MNSPSPVYHFAFKTQQHFVAMCALRGGPISPRPGKAPGAGILAPPTSVVGNPLLASLTRILGLQFSLYPHLLWE